MTNDDPIRRQLLRVVPDEPRWVEARSLLLAGDATIVGTVDGCVLCDAAGNLFCVVGSPRRDTIAAAVHNARVGAELLCDQRAVPLLQPALRGWAHEPVRLFSLPGRLRGHTLDPSAATVDFLEPGEHSLDHVPDELREELAKALRVSPVAACFVAGRPVAFCYAGSRTETLWDLSIDTLAESRRRGYAAATASYLIEHFQRQGLQPVWAAVESNEPSWRLALRLGFEQVGSFALFELEGS